MQLSLSLFFGLLVCVCNAYSQHNIGQGAAKVLYIKNCANCHGNDFRGDGVGGSLVDKRGKFAAHDDKDIFAIIKDGKAKVGMPSWGGTLSDEQIRSLVILIREEERLSKPTENKNGNKSISENFLSREYTFSLEKFGEGTNILWGIDFLPNGDALVTQQSGTLWLFRNGKRFGPIANTPKVLFAYQGGLLDVKVHPDYVNNGWVYLSYSEAGKNGSMTAVVRGKIDNKEWTNEEKIFSAPAKYHINTGHHYGSRFVLKNGYVFFGIGERGNQEQAQDLTRPNGKIHRLHDDGRVPSDNPFVNKRGAYRSIWSLGHRNPQGLDLHPLTGEIWESELGPRGGDEINLIAKGNNYGWPTITYGMNYDGTPITSKTESDGLEQPRYYWTPSISPSGIEFYEGSMFPLWKNSLFVAGMGARELHRLEIKNSQIVRDEIVIRNQGRIRDIATGPDGYLYLLINTTKPSSGSIYRLMPTAGSYKTDFNNNLIKERSD